MDIVNRTLTISASAVEIENQFSLSLLKQAVCSNLHQDEVPIRFVIVRSTDSGYECEVDVVTQADWHLDMFACTPRAAEDVSTFNIALMIPTGIGCELGGHAGDANVLARVFAGACDHLITHPNVVNAADYNEMTGNTLYVEGSVFTDLLMGQVTLRKVRKNKVLLLVDQHEMSFFNEEIVNAASTARCMLGVECSVHIMQQPVKSTMVWSAGGRAAGTIENIELLFDEIDRHIQGHDAIALSTSVLMPIENYDIYFKTDDMPVNPIGGIEAMLTHAVSKRYRLPCAHAPLICKEIWEKKFGILDPRKSAESNSVADIYCVLKGLQTAPHPCNWGDLSNANVSCLITPDGCVGLPTLAAFEQGIPVIAVEENHSIMKNCYDHFRFPKKVLFRVKNYWEALGVAQCLRQGVDPHMLRRPLTRTSLL